MRARGNYERDTYVISDEAGEFRAVPPYHEKGVSAVDIPRIEMNHTGSESSSIDQETRKELKIVESARESNEDIMRNVIGQATRAMRRQSVDSDNSYDEADSEDDLEESGNDSDF